MGLFRRSQDTLTHWGIPGQKWGVRRWQYPDGRFTEEGKERYFGKNAESEGYVTKNKDGSYSATDKGIEEIVKLTENYKKPYTMKEKLQSLFDSKANFNIELIELGREIVYRKAKTVTNFEYPNKEIARSARVDFAPEKNKKYNNYMARLNNSLDKLDTNGLYDLSNMRYDRVNSPGYKDFNTKYRTVKIPYGEDESDTVSKYWNK